jgi:hypothetical protein
MTVTSGASQYLENAVLNWFRGTTFPVVPTHTYLALFTTAPVGGTDAAAVEVTIGSNGYLRLQVTPGSTTLVAPTSLAPATAATGANQVFATPSGAGWGTIVGWGLYDAATAGNLLVYGLVTGGGAVASGDTVEFLTGNLTITVS